MNMLLKELKKDRKRQYKQTEKSVVYQRYKTRYVGIYVYIHMDIYAGFFVDRGQNLSITSYYLGSGRHCSVIQKGTNMKFSEC